MPDTCRALPSRIFHARPRLQSPQPCEAFQRQNRGASPDEQRFLRILSSCLCSLLQIVVSGDVCRADRGADRVVERRGLGRRVFGRHNIFRIRVARLLIDQCLRISAAAELADFSDYPGVSFSNQALRKDRAAPLTVTQSSPRLRDGCRRPVACWRECSDVGPPS
jgi:hypothetical protein